MYKILLVEDDPVIAGVIAQQLAGWGYEIQQVTDFENVMEHFNDFMPHLVLLDLGLPFHNGFHWCGEIRKISKVPVVFISSAGDSMNMVTAIHQGADDFVTKPFDMNVLVAKVQAILRRSYDFGEPAGVLVQGPVTLNLGEAAVYVNNEKTDLTRNEFKILELLMQNRGRLVSREELMRRLWESESFIDDNTLSVNIARLRKKLADAGLENHIETRKGLGYIIQ